MLFPLAGLHRGTGYQQYPPFTTPEAVNVVPQGPRERRLRGGPRPGLVKYFQERVVDTGDDRINLLAEVPKVGNLESLFWQDDYENGTVGNELGPPSVYPGRVIRNSVTLDLPRYRREGNYGFAGHHSPAAGYSGTLILHQFPDNRTCRLLVLQGQLYPLSRLFNTAGPSMVSFYFGGTQYNMDITNHDLVWVEFVFRIYNGSNESTINLGQRVSGSPNVVMRPWQAAPDYWWNAVGLPFRVAFHWTGSVFQCNAFLGDASFGASRDVTWPAFNPLKNVGFVIQQVGDQFYGVDHASLRSDTVSAVATYRGNTLVVGAAGQIYTNTWDDQHLTTAERQLTVESAWPIDAVPHYQKLYIADHRHRRAGTGNVNSTAKTLTDAQADFLAAGVNPHDDIVFIWDSSGTMLGAYFIEQVNNATTLLLKTAPPQNPQNARYLVQRSIKIYDPGSDQLTALETTAGIAPHGCRFIEVFNDRLVLAGDPCVPHAYYMSRAGVPTDFDYGASPNDPTRAVSGTTGDAGSVGEPITGLLAHAGDYLLLAGNRSLWRMNGDPAAGGYMAAVSRTNGPLSNDSWCLGPGGEAYLLTPSGLFVLPPGSGLNPIGQDRLPSDLRNIESADYYIGMIYDAAEHTLDMFFTPRAVTHPSFAWVYDLATNGFWRFELDGHGLWRILRRANASADSGRILLGCTDRYVRRMQERRGADDTIPLRSHVLLGPLRLGDTESRDGVLTHLSAIVGEESTPITLEIYAGSTAEEAVRRAQALDRPLFTATLQAGRNVVHHPRVRGAAVVFRLSGTGSWEMEKLVCTRKSGGLIRVI